MIRNILLVFLWIVLWIGELDAQRDSDGFFLQVLRFGAMEEAERVIARAKSGEGFDELVKEHAPEGLKRREGCVGKVFLNRVGSKAREALGKLRAGELVGPIQGETGWFVVRALDEQSAASCEASEEDLGFWIERGLILGELGDDEGEIDAYRKAVSVDPQSAEAHVNLGEALRRKGVRMLQEVVSGSKRASMDAVTELLDEAIDELKTAISLDKNLWEAHFDLGLAYAAQGFPELTVMEFAEALRLKGDSGDLHRAMAQVLLMLGRLDEAKRHLQRALELGTRVDDLMKELQKKSKEPPPKKPR